MVRLLLRCCPLLLVSIVSVGSDFGWSRDLNVYVSGRELHVFRLDLATGTLTALGSNAEAGASFIAIHPNGRHLYGVRSEVVAYSIDPETEEVERLNSQSAGGQGPCHIVIDKTGTNALVANYSGGNLSVLRINEDGSLGDITSTQEHRGTGPNPKRQQGPHPHSINLDPDNRFALAADLGIDKVVIYRFDAALGVLSNEPSTASVRRGAGPRHSAFHPKGRYAYVINELNSTVTAFRYDSESGQLTEIQTVSTLPPGFEDENHTAEVVVHPSGRFLYGSNRGHNSIAAFEIDSARGTLRLLQVESTGGKWPRNFNVDPTGSFLLAANQQSDNVVVFRIDQATGEIDPTGHVVTVPGPSCVKFVWR